MLNVVKEQITRALDKKQLPPSLENFRQNLSNCTYDHLKQIWEMERKTTEEKEAQARPIVYVQSIPPIWASMQENLTLLHVNNICPHHPVQS